MMKITNGRDVVGRVVRIREMVVLLVKSMGIIFMDRTLTGNNETNEKVMRTII